MALSGSFRQTFSNNGAHDLIVEWSAKQNIGGNYSDVTAKLFLKGNYSWSTIYSGGVNKAVSITIDGTRSPIRYATTNISGTQKKELMSWTKRVNHGSNGAKSFSISAIVDIEISWNGRYERSYSTSSRSFTLNTIPRASSLSGVTGSLDYGQALKFTINAADSSFRHTLHLNVPGYNGNILTGQTGGAKSYTTNRNWSSGIPNATSGRGTLKLLTYSGGTKIGEKSYGFTIRVPGDIVPSISSIGHSEANSKVSGVMAGNGYVQGISKVNFSINSSSSHGATIRGSEITVSGRTISGNSVDLNTLSGVSGNSVPVVVKVIDSRGRTAQRTQNIKILPYSAPRITSFSAQRTKGTNNVQVIRSGSVSSLKVGTTEKNTYTAKIESKQSGQSTWVSRHSTSAGIGNINLTNIDRAKSFTLRFTITDKFSTSTSQVSLPTEKTLLHLYRDEGIGIGKMRERGVLDVNGNVFINGSITVQNYEPLKVPANADFNNLTSPGFYYNNADAEVRTMANRPMDSAFSMEVRKHAGVLQIVTLYWTHNPRTYIRNYYSSSGWGRWELIVGEVEGDVAPSSGFYKYTTNQNDSNYPRAVRIGNIVTLHGALANSKAYAPGEIPAGSYMEIGRVPAWARPDFRVSSLQQGTKNRIFHMHVNPDGIIGMGRMRSGASDADIGTGNWLNIGMSYGVRGGLN